MNNKLQSAKEFIERMKTMSVAELDELIASRASPEVAEFFEDYVKKAIKRDPNHIIENMTTIMLLGFLIRDEFDRVPAPLRREFAAKRVTA